MEIRVKQDGAKVLVGIDNRTFLSIGPKEALQWARALVQCAKRAEEIQEAERIIRDGAILVRAGAPFTLSNHAKIIDEVAKEAVHSRDLRRYMPSVKSQEVFGLPTFTKGAPKQ